MIIQDYLNALLQELADQSMQERVDAYISFLQDEEDLMHEHNMQMYSCHSYD